jgi:UV DNA damage endonuclease
VIGSVLKEPSSIASLEGVAAAAEAVTQSLPARLGFAVKVLGREGLKSNDARRWQSGPHLTVSIGYLHAIFDYLAETGIRMYRVSSDVAPYVTHPDMPQFHGQIEESRDELAALGERARALDLRLSMHPSQYIVLNSPVERVAASAVADFAYHARFLDALGAGPEAKIVTHVGGVYGDRAGAMTRFVDRYAALPEAVRRRLVLENDEVSYGVDDTLRVHEGCGVPLVFDILHHRVNNPAEWSPEEAARRCWATWPADQTPKIHYSSQRALARTPRKGADPATARAKAGEHDDWIDAADFLQFVRATADVRFDVMLEAKAKDLALLRLRGEIEAAGLADRIW